MIVDCVVYSVECYKRLRCLETPGGWPYGRRERSVSACTGGVGRAIAGPGEDGDEEAHPGAMADRRTYAAPSLRTTVPASHDPT